MVWYSHLFQYFPQFIVISLLVYHNALTGIKKKVLQNLFEMYCRSREIRPTLELMCGI